MVNPEVSRNDNCFYFLFFFKILMNVRTEVMVVPRDARIRSVATGVLVVRDTDGLVLLVKVGYCPADLTVTKRPGANYRIKILFAVFNHLHLLFSFVKLVETL